MPASASPIITALARSWADVMALAFPLSCAGCDDPGTVLCASCRAALAPEPSHQRIDGVPVVSALCFAGVPARVIRALKQDGRTALARPLGKALAAVWPSGHSDAVMVPLPSSRAAQRRRGYAVVEVLTRRAGHHPETRLLRPARQGADQRGLGRDERVRNVAGTLRAAADARGQRVVLVDDVVTTGATLAEAIRVLRSAGAEVVGAVTLAATPRIAPRQH